MTVSMYLLAVSTWGTIVLGLAGIALVVAAIDWLQNSRR